MKNNRLYKFGQFSLDAEKLILWHEDRIVPLKPKALETLVALVRRGGEVVTKDELMDEVWRDSFVEENSLSRNVHELRKILNELSGEKFIETVPRRGYRFTGELSEVENGSEEIIIERQIFEQTLIEEVQDDDDFSLRKFENTRDLEGIRETGIERQKKNVLPPSSIFSRFTFLFPAVAAVLALVFVIGLAFRSYQNSQAKTSLSEIDSIAVLPLKSFSAGAEDETLRLRITDALITKLGGFDKFTVRPTNSVLPFLNESQNAVETGEKLQVDAVLDGRIQTENERLRVTLQLISVKTGEQLWAEQFDGRTNEILALQDAISNNLRQKFAFTESDKLKRKPTENSEAFEDYLTGRYFWNQRTPAALKRGIEHFKAAAEKDPNFALAYVGLAESYVLLTVYCGTPPVESFPLAREAALKVLELDRDNAATYTVLALISWQYDYDVAAAEQYFRQSLKYDPNNVTARHWYGEFLGFQKRFEEAFEELEKAQKLDPLSLVIKNDSAIVHYHARQFERAEAELRKTLEMNANFVIARVFLSKTLDQLGRKDEAIREIQAVADQYPNVGIWVGTLATSYAAAGRKTEAMQTLDKLNSLSREQFVPLYFAAVTYALLGDKERSLALLNQAFTERDWMLIYMPTDPNLDSLRDDARFQALLHKFERKK